MSVEQPDRRPPRGCLLALVTAAAVAVAGAPALAGDRAVARTEAASSSVRASAADVLADAPATGPVTVLAATRTDGRLEVTRLRAGTRAEAERAVSHARALPGILDIAVDSPIHLLGPLRPPGAVRLLGVGGAEDPLRVRQWALSRLRDREARTLSTGAGVLVAVLDTGIDATHEDLDPARVLPGTNYVPDGRRTPLDGNGHGTHVAGIIAAARDNGLGIAGLSDARILPMRVLNDEGAGSVSWLITAMLDAMDAGADVLNLSLGGTAYNAVLARVTADALAAGITVVAAGGNDRASGSPTEYPASLPGVLGVASHNSAGRSSTFSSTGSQVDLSAPGEGIASLAERGQYALMSGTSQAAPYATAAVAMLLAADPRLTPAQVTALLQETATDIDAPGPDTTSGAGALDVVAALQRLRPADPSAAPAAATPSPFAGPTA
ncbi:MAG: putative subtilase-family protease, partial [Frankiales bacterium]|nr:putative subtilase-family protease [Frankiales bacterium]